MKITHIGYRWFQLINPPLTLILNNLSINNFNIFLEFINS